MHRVAATVLAAATSISHVAGHGSLISPRSRNSVDYLVNVNTPKDWPSNKDCTNITGRDVGDCHNGQAGFYYSQGCFIGCPACDHVSGRRQVDVCGLGKKVRVLAMRLTLVLLHLPAKSALCDRYRQRSTTRSTALSTATRPLVRFTTSTSTIPGARQARLRWEMHAALQGVRRS